MNSFVCKGLKLGIQNQSNKTFCAYYRPRDMAFLFGSDLYVQGKGSAAISELISPRKIKNESHDAYILAC